MIKALISIHILRICKYLHISINISLRLKLFVLPLLKVKERLLRNTLETSSRLFDLANKKDVTKIKMKISICNIFTQNLHQCEKNFNKAIFYTILFSTKETS